MALIEIDSLSKRYPVGSQALKDLNLQVEEGKIVSIVGPFGCGKSTLLELLGGIREEYMGMIKIRGQNPKWARVKRKIGYTFQTSTLLPWCNVIENILLPCKIDGRREDRKARVLLEMVGLSHLALRMPYELSGGMQQLVGIVRSLMLDPDILLLDEPFSSIDEINRSKMHQNILRLHQKTNQTMVLVTHSVSEAVCLSDQVVVLTSSPGRVKRVIDICLPTDLERDIFSDNFLSYVKTIRGELTNGTI